ncbi:MAG: hypothetical protein KTR16_15745 [Acidiferrobacterales bacterium]|nr:hypothetical protein [Acidiferrobacterales bacterium]
MRGFAVINLVLIAILNVSITYAHHSFSSTFNNEVIAVEGVVERMSFTNPHVIVFFNVIDENGDLTEWIAEGGAATLKRREGWGPDSLVKGDYIQVTGNATHNGSPMVSMEEIKFVDPDSGSVVGSPGTGVRAPYAHGTMPMELADGRPNLTGYWASARRVEWPPLADFPFNEAGSALQTQYDIRDDPQVQCEPPGLIRQVGTPHPIRVEQQDHYVIIAYEEYGGIRTIYFDDRDLVGGDHSNFGQSIARYEDQKLIVETSNLTSNVSSGRGNITSDQTTTTEVFSRLPDADGASGINFEITITDLGHMTDSWTRSWQKYYTPEHKFIEVDCYKPLAF